MSSSYEHNFGRPYEQTLPTLGEAMLDIMRFFGATGVYGVGGFCREYVCCFECAIAGVHSAFEWCQDYDAALRAFAGLVIRAERLQGGAILISRTSRR